MAYITGRGIIGLEALCRDIATSMSANGFTVVGVDRVPSDVILPNAKALALDATSDVDGNNEHQKWTVLIEGNDLLRTVSVNILPTAQVSLDYRAPSRSALTEVGRLSQEGLTESYFIDMEKNWGVDPLSDLSAHPLSYNLSITDHGVALCVMVEGQDNTGTSFAWFVAQRGLTLGETFNGERSPLFCVYSIAGGQGGDPDVLNPLSIERFTVMEKDIHSASNPISAVVPTPDGYPIINPLQQVSLFEGNRACVLFPQLINTHRYMYFTKLDMLGYTSADVLSADSAIELTPHIDRIRYIAQSANGRDNRGMRILFPENKVGV